MRPTCSVCSHPKRETIDHELAEQFASRRRVAAHYGLSEASLRRHEARHLDPRLIEAARASLEASDAKLSVTALEHATWLVTKLRELGEQTAGVNGGQFLLVADRLVKAINLHGVLRGEIQSNPIIALFQELGVKSEDELKSAVLLARTGEQTSPQEMAEDVLEAARMLSLKHPDVWEGVKRRMDFLSGAEVVEALEPHTNGDGP